MKKKLKHLKKGDVIGASGSAHGATGWKVVVPWPGVNGGGFFPHAILGKVDALRRGEGLVHARYSGEAKYEVSSE